MESLAAFGLAGNIVTFIEFSQKILSKSMQIYHANNNASNDVKYLNEQLRGFLFLAEEVKEPSSKKGGRWRSLGKKENLPEINYAINESGFNEAVRCLVGHSTILSCYSPTTNKTTGLGSDAGTNQTADQAPDETTVTSVQEVAAQCSAVSQRLLKRLDDLKMKSGNRHRRWSSLKLAVQEVWAESEIEQMKRELATCSSNLRLHILVELRRHVEFISSRQTDQFNISQTTMRATLQELMQPKMQMEEPHEDSIPQPTESALEPSTETKTQRLPTQDQVLREVKKALANRRLLLNSKKLQRNLQDTLQDTLAIAKEVNECSSEIFQEEKELLNSFKFPVMRDREENITAAERETFKWVFEETKSTDWRWENFPQWFASDSPLYWFSGKAGSGKSTLMKYVFSHARTASLLTSWAKGVPFVAAGFFFWNAGGQMQKSQEGLLQSLIYQFLATHRELIPVAVREAKDQGKFETGRSWTKSQLKELLQRLVFQKVVPLKICLFIDGLDEYHGDYSDLTNFITQLAEHKNIKICVSSRPYSLFEANFKDQPRLKLEELTHEDIMKYAFAKFSANQRVCDLQRDNPDLAHRLAAAIVKKACGVFLWVKLVVRSLCEGLDKFDRVSDIEDRLRELPEDLLKLYMHMLTSIEKRYIKQASKLFQIVYRATKPLTLLQLGFADMEDEKLDVAWKSGFNYFSDKELDELCSSTEGRLRSRCLGLIEVASMPPSPSSHSRSRAVQFMHQTVVDFLEDERAKAHLIENGGVRQFNPYPCLMKAVILDMKHSEVFQDQQPATVLAQTWFQSSWMSIKAVAGYSAIEESNTKDPQTYAITELDRVATRLSQLYVDSEFRYDSSRDVHWSERRREGAEIRKIQQGGSILSFCLEFGIYITAHDILDLNKSMSRRKFSQQKIEFARLVEECAHKKGNRSRPDEWGAIKEYLNKTTNFRLRSLLNRTKFRNKGKDVTSGIDHNLLIEIHQFPDDCGDVPRDASDDQLILKTAFL